jgi:hypothetical protein
MKFPKGKYSAEQRAWCENYESRTGFDPLMEDFEAGNETFYEAATKSVSWFEDHSCDAFLSVSSNIPGFHAAFRAKLDAAYTPNKLG